MIPVCIYEFIDIHVRLCESPHAPVVGRRWRGFSGHCFLHSLTSYHSPQFHCQHDPSSAGASSDLGGMDGAERSLWPTRFVVLHADQCVDCIVVQAMNANMNGPGGFIEVLLA